MVNVLALFCNLFSKNKILDPFKIILLMEAG